MPSLKKNSRTHRSLSSYLSSLNKENHLDFGNRVPNLQKKGVTKMICEESVNISYEIKQSKAALIKPLPTLNLEPKENNAMIIEKMREEENNMIARNYGLDILDTLLESNRK